MALKNNGPTSKKSPAKSGIKTGAMIGWLASGAILIVVVIAVIYVIMRRASVDFGAPTLATSAPGALDVIQLDLDASKVTDVPTGKGAEQLYRQAIVRALNGKDVYDFIRREHESVNRLDDPIFRDVIALMITASDMGMDPQVQIVFKELPVKGNSDLAVQAFCKSLGHLLTNTAEEIALTKGNDVAAARLATQKYTRAALIYAARFWKQGVYASYRFAGLSVAGDALAQYIRYETDSAKKAVLSDLDLARMNAGKKWLVKANCSQRWDGRAEPGDLVNLALHDQDRSWRLVGVMWLGIVQWTNAGGEKRQAIQNLLRKLENDPDKYIAEQAKIAAETPRGDVQELGNQVGL